MTHPTPADQAAVAAATARTAADVRTLSDDALCALLDAAFWAEQQGYLAEIAAPEAHGEIVAAHERALLAS